MNLETPTVIDPLMNVRESAVALGISVPTFWRRVADGTIPKPVKLGGMSRWFKSDIDNVLEVLRKQRAA